MPQITTLFWDIGGVIMTNGWDSGSRRLAVETFHLDWEEFHDRHDLSFPAFDSGNISLNEYLNRTIFYRERPFTREEFTACMFAQSREYPEARAVLDALARKNKYLIGSINNEPFELTSSASPNSICVATSSSSSVRVTCTLASQRRPSSASPWK